jgi:hypothetical protein
MSDYSDNDLEEDIDDEDIDDEEIDDDDIAEVIEDGNIENTEVIEDGNVENAIDAIDIIDAIDDIDDIDDPKEKIDIKKKKISNPPLVSKNSILELSNKSINIIIVANSDRITSNFLNKEEISQLLSIRATHIDKYGCPEYMSAIVSREKMEKPNISATDIAELELKHRMVPLNLQRYIGTDGKSEYYEIWNPNVMNIIDY